MVKIADNGEKEQATNGTKKQIFNSTTKPEIIILTLGP